MFVRALSILVLSIPNLSGTSARACLPPAPPQAIRTLYQLSNSDTIKLRVCERALAALEGLKGTANADPGDSNHMAPQQKHRPAASAYPASEILWLSASCRNEALRHSQGGAVGASAADTAADEPRPLSKEGIRYHELAGALSAHYPAAGTAPGGMPVG